MVIIKFLFWSIVLSILFRVITRFIIPVFRMASTTRQHMKKMQEQMNQMDQKVNTMSAKQPIAKTGDYIDYEEIK